VPLAGQGYTARLGSMVRGAPEPGVRRRANWRVVPLYHRAQRASQPPIPSQLGNHNKLKLPRPGVARWQEPMWWNLSARVKRAEPRCKSSYHPQPASPCGSLYTLRLHGPTECVFRGDELRFLALQEIEEAFEGGGWFLEFVPRARRSAMYCLSARRKGFIAHLYAPAMAGQPHAMTRRPPGCSRMWSFGSDGEELPQSPAERRHGESSALLSHGGTDGRRHARSGESPLVRALGARCVPPPPAQSDRYAAPTFRKKIRRDLLTPRSLRR